MNTTAYGLKKPDNDDFYSVGVYNDNMELLDGLIGRGHTLRVTFAPELSGRDYSVTDENGETVNGGSVKSSTPVLLPLKSGHYSIQCAGTVRSFTTPEKFGIYDMLFSPVSSVLADNGWETIADLSEQGSLPTGWSVGDEKKLTLLDGTDLTLQIYGFNHDTIAGTDKKAGITFGLKYLPPTPCRFGWANIFSEGGYMISPLCEYINNVIYDLIPDEVKTCIKTVRKKCKVVSYGTGYPALRLFAFGGSEIVGDAAFVDDGTQYALFSGGGSAVRQINGGRAQAWWLRSQGTTNSTSAACIDSTGKFSTGIETATNYINFGFCI